MANDYHEMHESLLVSNSLQFLEDDVMVSLELLGAFSSTCHDTTVI